MEEIKLSSVSKVDSDEKIGEFWDTHDFTEFDSDAPDAEFGVPCTVPRTPLAPKAPSPAK